ncbi:MAG TPA: NAD(P)-dependent oxidoreductase [Gemmatimonadaceae bacterium]|nr:NAD(P)-dependent oxidoreductase [Gemmatimonadaceae bacterium]
MTAAEAADAAATAASHPFDLGDDARWDEWRRAAPPAPPDEGALDDALSAPSAATIAALARCPGDVVVLGAGGKMGPTLARMVRRTLDALPDANARRVVAVSRFASAGSRASAEGLNAAGIETVACDLSDARAVARDLPDAPNVFFMAGQKFGTAAAPGDTWMMNTVVPAYCADRYRDSRVVAFSTGNVYPLTPATRGGSRETDTPAPVGEYAASCLGRERVLEHFAARHGTRVALVRLNYAVDLRYGVLTDVALKVWRGEPVDVTMGWVNVIWQRDACDAAVACLPHAASPDAFVVNVTGAELLSVRDLATRFGTLLGRPPVIVGHEAPDALLSNTSLMSATFGDVPRTPLAQVMLWTASWIRAGGRLLGKPTKFEVRSGEF